MLLTSELHIPKPGILDGNFRLIGSSGYLSNVDFFFFFNHVCIPV